MNRITTPQVIQKNSPSLARRAGFSLIELLSVMAILAMLMALVAPAVSSIKGGNDISRSAYDIASTLQEARSYAIANNTYVWVGFYEEDGSKTSSNPATAGNGGRLVVSVVASQDGTRYSDANVDGVTPAAFGSGGSNPTTLVQICRLLKFDNVRMAALNNGSANGGGYPARPGVQTAYQLGDALAQSPNNSGGAFALHVGAGSINPTTFKYPLTAATPQYTFSKIIEFNPQGEASKIVENVFTGPGPQDAMEIALVPTHGATVDGAYSSANKAAAAVQIEGMTGQVRIFRL